VTPGSVSGARTACRSPAHHCAMIVYDRWGGCEYEGRMPYLQA